MRYFDYSENLNWAIQNLRLGRGPRAGHSWTKQRNEYC